MLVQRPDGPGFLPPAGELQGAHGSVSKPWLGSAARGDAVQRRLDLLREQCGYAPFAVLRTRPQNSTMDGALPILTRG
jgi:hypothetical protein